MYQLLKPLLFQINPEKAHHLTLSLLKTALAIPGYAAISDATLVPDNSKWNRTVAGLHFKILLDLLQALIKMQNIFR